jgi:hypothetical protein
VQIEAVPNPVLWVIEHRYAAARVIRKGTLTWRRIFLPKKLFDSALSISTPRWFLDAVRTATSVHETMAEGARISYRGWNADDVSKPPLLFVHGHRGHNRWWDFIAPYFRDRFRVFALDLSGMGDSGHRPSYTPSYTCE